MTSMRSGAIDPKLDIPEIEVTFTNGVKQRLVLRHYDAIPNSDSADKSRFCNYLGHLEGDEVNSTVAVTGCLMGHNLDEKVHITLLSQHSPQHKSFSFDKNGNTNHIETQSSNVSSRDLFERMQQPNDEVINDQWEQAAAKVTNQQRSTVPAILTIKYRLGYDRTAKKYFENQDQMYGAFPGNVDKWLAEMMTHVQSFFLHSSLKHQIILKVEYN